MIAKKRLKLYGSGASLRGQVMAGKRMKAVDRASSFAEIDRELERLIADSMRGKRDVRDSIHYLTIRRAALLSKPVLRKRREPA